MALNVTEADAVNNVVKALVDSHRDRQEAIEALVLLVRAAHKKLMAGYRPEEARAALEAAWPQGGGSDG